VRRRIVVSIVGVAVIAMLLLGIPLGYAVEQFYAKEQVLYLHREASEAIRGVNPSTLRAGQPGEIHDEDGIHLAAYDRAGQKLGGTGPVRGDQLVMGALRGEPDDARIDGETVVAIPLYNDGRTTGAIRASESRSVVVARTARAWLIMGALAVAALVIVVLLALRQANRLTRPIDDLVRSAERLGGGDFSVRAEASGIPELDQVGEALDNTAVRLGNLVARERSFSSDASHQLRTPLAGLRVGVESALLTPGADLRYALENTLGPIDRLETTISSFLELARDTRPERGPLDASRLLRELETEWAQLPDTRDRTLAVSAAEGIGQPTIAEPAIHQIMNVLLENALIHGAGTVTVRARSIAGATTIDVTDEGSGPTDIELAFSPPEGGAHGNGLPLARSLAEAEGARLVYEHDVDGPTFRLILPVPEPELDHDERSPSARD
jgi:signal transduction histidine kinase